MFLPIKINLGFRQIDTILIFVFLGFIISFFAIWYESKKDGFERERFIDLFLLILLISGASCFGLYRFLNYLTVYRPGSMFLSVNQNLLMSFMFIALLFLCIIILSKKFKWSFFRLFDIYSLGLNIFGVLVSLGAFFIYKNPVFIYILLAGFVFYLLVSRFRGYKYTSGFVFSMFTFFISVLGLIFYRVKGYLLFYPILVSISVVNIYFRSKKAMANKSLTKQFIQKIKNILAKKDKDLARRQQQLIENDPYLQEDRDEGNSDIADEVALEDVRKVETDASLAEIEENRDQIGEALESIQEDDYGICQNCGKLIDKDRLEAYPEATLCKKCSEDKQQQENAFSKEEKI